MADDSTPLLSVELADSVAKSNLGSILVSSDCITARSDLGCNLSRKDIPNRAILVHNAKRLAVHFDDTGNGGSIELDEIVNIVNSQLSIGSHFSRKSKIFTENCNLLHTHVTEESNSVVLDLDYHTQFVLITTASNDLDVITLSESFAQGANRRVNCLSR
jgi:hypothetical protein